GELNRRRVLFGQPPLRVAEIVSLPSGLRQKLCARGQAAEYSAGAPAADVGTPIAVDVAQAECPVVADICPPAVRVAVVAIVRPDATGPKRRPRRERADDP